MVKVRSCSSRPQASNIFARPRMNCPSAGPYHSASSSMLLKNGVTSLS